MSEPRPSGAAGLVGLRVSASLLSEVFQHLLTAAPCEGVGLLAGIIDGSWAQATAFYQGTNVDASPTRYTMAPEEVISAFRDMRSREWRLAAIVHSHPASVPVPSATDLMEAYYPEALLLIVGLATRPPIARCWRLVSNLAAPEKEVVEVVLSVGGREHRGQRDLYCQK